MTQQQPDERAQEAWEAFLSADWRTADARLNDLLAAWEELVGPVCFAAPASPRRARPARGRAHEVRGDDRGPPHLPQRVRPHREGQPLQGGLGEARRDPAREGQGNGAGYEDAYARPAHRASQKYVVDGRGCSADIKEQATSIYQAYHDLGGNGTGTHLYGELMEAHVG